MAIYGLEPAALCSCNRKNHEMYRFDHPLTENSLGDNDVLSLATDRGGIVWAGSHLGAGVTKIQPNNAKFNLVKYDSRSKFA